MSTNRRDPAIQVDTYLGKYEGRWRWHVAIHRHGIEQRGEVGYARTFIGASLALARAVRRVSTASMIAPTP